MFNQEHEYAKKVAEIYVKNTNRKEDYDIAYSIGKYVFNTGKYGHESIEKFLKDNDIKSNFNISAIIMAIINVKFIKDEKEIHHQLKTKIRRASTTYLDKKVILDFAFEECTRKGYDALRVTLDEFDSDEMKIIRKFVERYAANFNTIRE